MRSACRASLGQDVSSCSRCVWFRVCAACPPTVVSAPCGRELLGCSGRCVVQLTGEGARGAGGTQSSCVPRTWEHGTRGTEATALPRSCGRSGPRVPPDAPRPGESEVPLMSVAAAAPLFWVWQGLLPFCAESRGGSRGGRGGRVGARGEGVPGLEVRGWALPSPVRREFACLFCFPTFSPLL